MCLSSYRCLFCSLNIHLYVNLMCSSHRSKIWHSNKELVIPWVSHHSSSLKLNTLSTVLTYSFFEYRIVVCLTIIATYKVCITWTFAIAISNKVFEECCSTCTLQCINSNWLNIKCCIKCLWLQDKVVVSTLNIIELYFHISPTFYKSHIFSDILSITAPSILTCQLNRTRFWRLNLQHSNCTRTFWQCSSTTTEELRPVTIRNEMDRTIYYRRCNTHNIKWEITIFICMFCY